MANDLRWMAAIAADIEFVRSFRKRYDRHRSTTKSMRKLATMTRKWFEKYPALKPHPGQVLSSRLYIEFSNYKHIIKGEAG